MPYDKDSEYFRIERSLFIQDKLRPSNISKITMEDVKDILDCFHCLNSYPINRTKIPNNNKLENIIKAWDSLLNTGSIDSTKIESTKRLSITLGIHVFQN